MSARYMKVPLDDPSVKLELGSPFTYGGQHSIDRRYQSIFSYGGGGDALAVDRDSREQTCLSKFFHLLITAVSYLLVILTLPVSLIFCLKLQKSDTEGPTGWRRSMW